MFHGEELKSPAKSGEVCCFLLSLVDCHKELSLPLAQMNKTYLSCIHRGIVEKYIDLYNFSSICYCSVRKYLKKWLQVRSSFYQMYHSAVANKRSLFPRFITAAHAYTRGKSAMLAGYKEDSYHSWIHP